jgi:lipid-A-disaccharide synthase
VLPAIKAPHIRLLAGEASGDLLGASLMRALKKLHPGARFSGIGGPNMTAEGLVSEAEMERLSVMGFFEPLKRLPELLAIRRRFVAQSLMDKPDLFVGIDSPDFNLPIARKLREQGLRTAHYVSPSVWAWRQKRVIKIKASVDIMLTLFPFETKFYEEHAVPAVCVGHPMADEIALEIDPAAFRRQLSLAEQGRLLAVLPGSRKGEVKSLIPIFAPIMRELAAKHPDLHFVIPAANPALRALLDELLTPDLLGSARERLTITDGESRAAMAASDAVLLASGTSTLEAMLLKKPMVMAYRLSAITHSIVKHMIKLPYFSLPNLLSQQHFVPEFIQHDATPENMLPVVEQALFDSDFRSQRIEQFQRIHEDLQGNASEHAAQALSELL